MLLSFQRYPHPRHLHSFPTRRSSDLAFPTPGHASHHVSYLDDSGTLYAGDATGVRVLPARYVFPAAPPPDIDLEAWHRTLEDRKSTRLNSSHLGISYAVFCLKKKTEK